MHIRYTDQPDGIRTIELAGSMDMNGAESIDLRFTALTSTERGFVIIDLSQVDFLASLGIATLMRSAKAIRLRDGYMVLLNPQPNVAEVLRSTAIDRVLPIFYDVEEARIAVRTARPAVR